MTSQNTEINESLLKASKCGDIDAMKRLVLEGASLNTQDSEGNTPLLLCLANEHDDTDGVRYCLASGADVHIPNHDGDYPIHMAVAANSQEMIELLASHGADINATQKKERSVVAGKTPLMLAVFLRNWTAAKTLLSLGADVNKSDSNGLTPLHLAVQSRNHDAVGLLYHAGADINKRTSRGYTPVHFAELTNSVFIFLKLFELAGGDNFLIFHNALRCERSFLEDMGENFFRYAMNGRNGMEPFTLDSKTFTEQTTKKLMSLILKNIELYPETVMRFLIHKIPGALDIWTEQNVPGIDSLTSLAARYAKCMGKDKDTTPGMESEKEQFEHQGYPEYQIEF